MYFATNPIAKKIKKMNYEDEEFRIKKNVKYVKDVWIYIFNFVLKI